MTIHYQDNAYGNIYISKDHDTGEERIEKKKGVKLKLSHEEHHEEDDGPHGGAGKLEDHLWISEKHEAWTAFNHLGHFCSLFQRDVAQDGESDATGQ